MERFNNIAVLSVWMAWVVLGCKDDTNSSTQTATDTAIVPTDSRVGTGAVGPTDTAGSASDTTSMGSSTDTGIGDIDVATDTSAILSCVGMRCNTPPGNACNGAVSLAVYNRVGWCDNGKCRYAYRDEACESGSCSSGICTASPCQGVTCDTPPAAECVDRTTLKVYNPSGYCKDDTGMPECAYASRSVTCEGGCQDGECVGDPCANVTCDDAPARYCDGDELVTWNRVPRCEDGECVYEEMRDACGPGGCADGRCAADNSCAGVTCDIPPAAYCKDDQTLRMFTPGGACQEGACLFDYEEIPCTNGCAQGQCTGEPCTGVTCTAGVANRCQDDATLVSWNGEAGTCIEGVCAYGVAGTVCQGGCDNARCTENPCTGVTCGNPPADYCLNDLMLLAFSNPGNCQGGVCTYLLEQVSCEAGCDQGACEAVSVTATDTAVESISTDTGEVVASDTEEDTDTVSPESTDTAMPTDTDEGDSAIACTEETAAALCGGNPCEDGYCCNVICNGFCEACNIPGSEGRCAPVPDGSDPDNECLNEASYTCGTMGHCDGQGECAKWPAGTVCDDGNECSGSEDTCNGEGRCEGGDPLPDFTPCEIVTENDRAYDICVSGICVSPGCGDISCNVPGPHFPLADTGHRQCKNENAVTITCPAEGEDFYGQDAQYGWDVTHSEAERFYRDVTYVTEPIVEDNVTGLTWQGEFATSAMTWSEALTHCDTLDWSGYTGWRLPDIYELNSIVDRRVASPALYTGAFPGGRTSNAIWSSTTYSLSPSSAWVVTTGYGLTSGTGKSGAFDVLCVRGTPTPHAGHYVKNIDYADNPVVTDGFTGLMWQGCVAGLTGELCSAGSPSDHTWTEALNYCETLTWADSNDWRLPNVVELQSIVQYNVDVRSAPAIDGIAFPMATESVVWTSTAYYISYLLTIDLDDGEVNYASGPGRLPIRCVRDVPPE